MKIKKNKIFIAGGSGLLGTALTLETIKKGYNVTSSFHSKIQNKKIKKYYKKYNFINIKDCIRASKNMDCVIICAVKASGVELMKKKKNYHQILSNIRIRSNLFEACKINNIKNVIWISSATVYQPANYPIKENQLNLNIEPYNIYQSSGWGYRYIEKLAKYYNENFNLNIKILRTTNIYGPYDNFENKKSHVIPALIKKVLNNKKKKLIVWGNGKEVRDFIYVEDLAKAIVKLVKIKKLRAPLNFSSGKVCTIKSLAKKIVKIYGLSSKLLLDKSKPSSAKYMVLNNHMANKILKFRKRTNLDVGLEKTINWYLKNG